MNRTELGGQRGLWIATSAVSLMSEPVDWALTMADGFQHGFNGTHALAFLPFVPGSVAVVARNAGELGGLARVGTGFAAENGSNIVYRALSAADAEALVAGRGLSGKAVDGTWSAAQHVANRGPGVGGAAANSPWISTTRSLDVARAYDGGNGIVRIDLSKVPQFQTEVWRSAPRVNGAAGLPYYRSIWAQEVTVFQGIPASAILGPVR